MQLSKPDLPVEINSEEFHWKAFQGKVVPISLAVASFAIAVFVSVLLQIQNEGAFIGGKLFILSYACLFASFVIVRPVLGKGVKRLLSVLIIMSTIANILHYWNGAHLTSFGRQTLEGKLDTPIALFLSVALSFLATQHYFPREKRVLKWNIFFLGLIAQIFIAALFKSGHLFLVFSAISLILIIWSSKEEFREKFMFKPFLGFLIPVSIFLSISFLQAYQPVEIAGPVLNSLGNVLSTKTKGLKLHVFNTGFNRMSKTLSPGSPKWRPAPAFVIEHPTKGLVVFDCGLSADVAQNGEKVLPFPMGLLFESRGEPEQTLDEQMKKAGLDPKKVSYVILSHFHEDHTGTLKEFRNARLIIGGKDKPEQFNQYNILNKKSLLTANSFLGKSIDLFGDSSLIIMPGGGHSAEDQLLWLNLENGPCVLTGDAVVHFEWLKSSDVERVAVNGERAAEVRNNIRKLMEVNKEILIFPGHDMPEVDEKRRDIKIENPVNFRLETWKSVRDDEKQLAEINQ
jgi:N-acyl homoserine lactone hydrolase